MASRKTSKETRNSLLKSSLSELNKIIKDPNTPPSVRVQAIQQKMKIAEMLPSQEDDEFAAFRTEDDD